MDEARQLGYIPASQMLRRHRWSIALSRVRWFLPMINSVNVDNNFVECVEEDRSRAGHSRASHFSAPVAARRSSMMMAFRWDRLWWCLSEENRNILHADKKADRAPLTGMHDSPKRSVGAGLYFQAHETSLRRRHEMFEVSADAIPSSEQSISSSVSCEVRAIVGGSPCDLTEN